jgi:hypothetical protein
MDGLACGALTDDRIVSMAAMDADRRPSLDGGRNLLAFKSVGTAVHDLSLASVLIELAQKRGYGHELGELTRLKPFAEQTVGAQTGVPGTR